jgi:outer membrane protein assembly factor BamB
MRPSLFSVTMAFVSIWGACQHAPQIPPQLHWRTQPFGAGVPIQMMNPIFYKGDVVVAQPLSDSVLCIALLSTQDGQVRWQCTDTAIVHGSFYYNLSPCLLGSTLFVPSGSVLLAIDLDTGKRRWRTRQPLSGEDHLATDGQFVYRSYMRQDFSGSFIFKINPNNGTHQILDSILFEPPIKGFARTPVTIGKEMLVFSYIAQSRINNQTSSLLCFFDLKSNQIIQRDTIYPANQLGQGVNKQPLYDAQTQNLYIVANDQLVCYNVTTRIMLWRRQMRRDILTSDLLSHQNKLYWPGEDGMLYQLDAATGTDGWSISISGTPSRMGKSGKYLHIIGGGNGLWQIIDTQSGIVVHTQKPPTAEAHLASHFERPFAVHPTMHKAVLTDGKEIFLFNL